MSINICLNVGSGNWDSNPEMCAIYINGVHADNAKRPTVPKNIFGEIFAKHKNWKKW